MDDLISRQDAIEATRYLQTYKLFESDDMLLVGLADVQTTLMMLPSAQQWITCSERLPDQNGKYLVVGRQKAINILKFDGGRWCGKWGVVAWMPLPDCYQGDEK